VLTADGLTLTSYNSNGTSRLNLWKQKDPKIAVAWKYEFISVILEEIHSQLLAQLLVVEELPPSLLDDLE
jgi:hypothetical protein